MVASAAILAGGRARRFDGRNKGALLVGGRTIIDRQLAVLRQVADDIVLVGGREAPPGTRLLVDRVEGSGPLAGLDAALAGARHDPVIVVACDMPFLTTSFLVHLVRMSADVDAVVPETERGYHPLCAVYRRSCHATVLRHLEERRLKMVELFEDLNIHVVERATVRRIGGAQVLANVNTPAELHDLEALLGHEL